MKKPARIVATTLAILAPAFALAGGWKSGGVTGIAFNDPYTPASGTFTVTGGLTATGNIYTSGGSFQAATGSALVNHADSFNGIALGDGAHSMKFLGDYADSVSTTEFVFVANGVNLRTPGAEMIELRNNTNTKIGEWSYAGGMGLGSSLTIVSANGFAQGTATFVVTQAGGLTAAGNIRSGSGSTFSSSSGDSYFDTQSAGKVHLRPATNDSLIAEAVAADPTSLVGQVEIPHLAGGSGAPTSPTAGSGCGTSSAIAMDANSSDAAGSVTFTCGSAGSAGNPMVTATFAHAYNTAPHCLCTANNPTTAATMVTSRINCSSSTTGSLHIDCGTGGTCPSSGAQDVAYVCVQ